MTYTTPKDFELFKKECNRLIDLLNLNDWEFAFLHQGIDDSSTNTAYYRSRIQILRFAKEIELLDKRKSSAIKDYAREEVFHGLLSNLSTMAFSRSLDADIYNSEEHAVIHRIQHMIKKLEGK